MLPTTIAPDIKRQVLHYLEATFNFRHEAESRALNRFLNDPEEGIFKGPWIQLRKPFRPADAQAEQFFVIPPPFHPFKHQWRSWARLNTRDGRKPESTLVTTGTGSGKTECFLFPVLDYCLRQKRAGKKGIKAIVLYPMNALASDQAGRFAETIWGKDGQGEYRKAGLTVGIYTGRYDPSNPHAQKENDPHLKKAMGARHAINDRDTIQKNPPDVLLTNYKMLDFLLMRPGDQKLWQFNEPGVLRYLILDELHTYDGAQASDVGCLIRRLKDRLDIERGALCCVGTSATIADKGDGLDRLLDFAGRLFEESFTREAVIEEDRLSIPEIVSSDPLDEETEIFPDAPKCAPWDHEDAAAYTKRQATLWGAPDSANFADRKDPEEAWEVALGEWLKRHSIFRLVLGVTEARPIVWRDFLDQCTEKDFRIRQLKHDERDQLLASFFALVARAKEVRSGKAFPLTPTYVQIWIRELRRLGRMVSPQTEFSWLDETNKENKALPAFHCSECGESGWIGWIDGEKDSEVQSRGVQGHQLTDDYQEIYRRYFGRGKGPNPHRGIVIIAPWREEDTQAVGQIPLPTEEWYISGSSLVIRQGAGNCPLTDSPMFRVKLNRQTKQDNQGHVLGDQRCPCCESREAIFLIGSQAATIGSVAIDEMFGSMLNDDPKLLAFTDSVQDASHRAGFFTARTFHFTFRTALKHLLDGDQTGAGIPLAEIGPRLLDYWAANQPGRLGAIQNAMALLAPPDLSEHTELENYRQRIEQRMGEPDYKPGEAIEPPKDFRKAFADRLTWEATSEFGLNLTHGRTMELNGAACIAWNPRIIEAVRDGLRERIPAVCPALEGASDELITLWILGILHRARERGALYHRYLDTWARMFAWGKFLPRGDAPPEREIFPSAGRFRPRLITNFSHGAHDNILAQAASGRLPWLFRWTRRLFPSASLSDAAVLDLVKVFLNQSREGKLLVRIHEDGAKHHYGIHRDAARLVTDVHCLRCSESGHQLIRDSWESSFWENAPSLSYTADRGRYKPKDWDAKQKYYQERYRKGALRRVRASEHTGLLTTSERENLEDYFKTGKGVEAPNVLACTSTLEMGIDIGDLSSTMLCSIPPTTASYLQRIGRAGRSTGTALIVGLVNQKPHDLYFYARPDELLFGQVEPPGCWLDASAVLLRHYLAYCFDCGVKAGELKDIPSRGSQLCDDLKNPAGLIPRLFEWIRRNEHELRGSFLKRFRPEPVQADTEARFLGESDADQMQERVRVAAEEFYTQIRENKNAQARVRSEFEQLDPETNKQEYYEAEAELKVLRGRARSLSMVPALEVLINFGLLPNYAFPERGVRFFGGLYSRHKGRNASKQNLRPIELIRSASTAIRELAPGNTFYTHSKNFDVQQIAVGNEHEPLSKFFAVCGKCGHMRPTEDLDKPDAVPACPQCGHADDEEAQTDQGRHKEFLFFPDSESISYMELYDALSTDKGDERDQAFYQLVNSFDTTDPNSIAGAVGEDGLPFGIEFRSSFRLRQVNCGYADQERDFVFGVDTEISSEGFTVCADCGVALLPGQRKDNVNHRSSCKGRKRTEAQRQKGMQGSWHRWKNLYLFRELKSEAIRLLLPLIDDTDIETLKACIFLGLRLRFQGNPGHLIILPQIIPQADSGLKKHYLVIMDAVPGGTGYLKTLYQDDAKGTRMKGEGIMEILRLARDALESCRCRQLSPSEDTDGCYRCVRTYHLQFSSDEISRERGIRLLNQMIAAGEKRTERKALDAIQVRSLYESILEKKFVDRLRAAMQDKAAWSEALIEGRKGFRLVMNRGQRIWDLSLQPEIGLSQGVTIPCRPDFLLSCNDESILPVAIFCDGFEPHVNPQGEHSRISDDIEKRRSLIRSGRYLVWTITWEDLLDDSGSSMTLQPACHPVARRLEQLMRDKGKEMPVAEKMMGSAMQQLLEYVLSPYHANWQMLVREVIYFYLDQISKREDQYLSDEAFESAFQKWSTGLGFAAGEGGREGKWIALDKLTVNTGDVLFCLHRDDALLNDKSKLGYYARLGESAAERSAPDYRIRWRRFWTGVNLFQFLPSFSFWSTSEANQGAAPSLDRRTAGTAALPPEWQEIKGDAANSVAFVVEALAEADCPLPVVEHYDESLPEEVCAELGWVTATQKLVLLVGDQEAYQNKWQDVGYRVVTLGAIQAQGVAWFVSKFTPNTEEVTHG